MSCNTWAKATFHPDDYARNRDDVDDIFGGEPGIMEGGALEFETDDIKPYQVWEPLLEAGVPFIGMHGACPGDYGACLIAFDGSYNAEHPCDDDGDLSIPRDLLSDGIVPEDTAIFLRCLKRMEDYVSGKVEGLERSRKTLVLGEYCDLSTAARIRSIADVILQEESGAPSSLIHRFSGIVTNARWYRHTAGSEEEAAALAEELGKSKRFLRAMAVEDPGVPLTHDVIRRLVLDNTGAAD